MVIRLPEDVEDSIQYGVQSGRFISVDDAMTAAALLLLRELGHEGRVNDPGPGSIGAMRDDAEWLDKAVEHVMKVREERPWRLNDGEEGTP